MRTSDEQLERMEALLRRMAKQINIGGTAVSVSDYQEARAIVAEIDGPPDDIKAGRELLLKMHEWFSCSADKNYKEIIKNINNGVWDNSTPMANVLACIAKGRELERADWLAKGKALREKVEEPRGY